MAAVVPLHSTDDLLDVTVNMLSGQLYTFKAGKEWTLQNVKDALYECSGIRSDEQRLLWDEAELQDVSLLLSSISAGATLALTFLRRSAVEVEQRQQWLSVIWGTETTSNRRSRRNLSQKLHDFEFAPDYIRGDWDIALGLLEVGQRADVVKFAGANLCSNQRFVLAAVKACSPCVGYVCAHFHSDREIMLAAVSWNNGHLLEFAADNLRNDPEFMLAALHVGGGVAMKLAAVTLRDNRDFAIAAVQGCRHEAAAVLENISERLRHDRVFVREAIDSCPRYRVGELLKWASENVQL